MDWNDALSALKANMPESPESAQVEEQGKVLHKAKLDISFEKKGRAGKSVTIISGFTCESNEDIAAVAASLKSALGTGGSARGGEILIQGDRRVDVGRKLAEMGYKSRVI